MLAPRCREKPEQRVELWAGPGRDVGHRWEPDTPEVLWVIWDGSFPALCRTVAPEKRDEYELTESTG